MTIVCDTNAPRVAFLEHLENGVLIDAQEVTLEDPTGTWGIREAATEKIVIPPGVPTVHVATGMYEYNIDSLNTQIEYEIFWKVIDSGGNTEYIYGVIPEQEISGGGSGGVAVPADKVGTGVPIDADCDGIVDGYAYDLDGDGYAESYDWNNDKIIDEIDLGKVCGACGCNSTSSIRCSSCSACMSCGTSGSCGCFNVRGNRIVCTQDDVCGIPSQGTPNVCSPPDGIPDVPSPRGKPAGDGTWGGTLGYDGTSGDVPATGGARSNRSKHGDGFWDGISFENLCVIPIGPRGQCMKDKAHAMVRVLLKDTDPLCQAFSNDELDMLLELSLADFNAKPTFTAFLWDQMQDRWLSILAKGATVFALYSQGLIEAGREFVITDNGISFQPPPVSDKLHSYASALLAHYEKELMDIKQNFRPMPAAVGVFSVLDISPSLRRLRHLREKRIF